MGTKPEYLFWIIVDNRHPVSDWRRFSKTINVLDSLSAGKLSKITPFNQSDALSTVYSISRDSASLQPLANLNPQIIRQWRGILYRSRNEQRTVNLLSSGDTRSSLANRYLLERLLRGVDDTVSPINLFLAVDRATPSEYRQAVTELNSLNKKAVRLASTFPSSSLYSKTNSRQLVDAITSVSKQAHLGSTLPTLGPRDSSEVEIDPYKDIFLVANHRISGWNNLAAVLREDYNNDLYHFEVDLPRPRELDERLARRQYVVAIYNDPYMPVAYLGTQGHEYLESVRRSNATDVLAAVTDPLTSSLLPPKKIITMINEGDDRNLDDQLAQLLIKLNGASVLGYLIHANPEVDNLAFSLSKTEAQ